MKRIISFFINSVPRPWLIRISFIFMRLVSVMYRGDKVVCPVCTDHFRKFLPYGYGPVRENALCPGCLSLERHRLLWLFLTNKTDFFTARLKVLHIAPEQCFYKRFRNMKNLDYVTADLESPLADVRMDIQDMPFDADTFDVVICNHVLEHIPDDRKAMREVNRVLKTGGYAFLLVPVDHGADKTFEDPAVTDPADRARLFRQKDHYRIYGKDYLERISESGFQVRGNNYLEELPVRDRERYGLPGQEFMFGYYKV